MIHFVGAGPGAPDLLTVRAARLIAAADLIVYAGSLVNPAVLDGAKPGCSIMNSASMTLEEVVDALVAADEAGRDAVRLHTGDPALFGAIAEQMRALERAGVAFDVVPGVSSLFAAVAALKAEFTAPGVSQSLVITRVAGRTPVPDGERLSALAAHGSSIALFLSAGRAGEAQRALLEAGVAPETPAAIVYKASWPDEKVVRCTVATLAGSARAAGVSRTALMLVGRFLDPDPVRSRLYDPSFSHGYRRASRTARADGAGALAHPVGEMPVQGVVRAGESDVPRPNAGQPLVGRVAIAAFTRRGLSLACRLARLFSNVRVAAPAPLVERCAENGPASPSDGVHASACAGRMHNRAGRLSSRTGCREDALRADMPFSTGQSASVEPMGALASWTREAFAHDAALVFVGATGIAVRACAPYVSDKFCDPAVVAVDEAGRVAVPLLSGHMGGANDLAHAIAGATGGIAAVSTATDVNGMFSVDVWARDQGLAIVEREAAQRVSVALLEGQPVGLSSACPVEGRFPAGIEPANRQETGIAVGAFADASPFPVTLHLVPRSIVAGIGCKRGVSESDVEEAVGRAFAAAGVYPQALGSVASIDLKRGETGLLSFARTRGVPCRFYSAAELAQVGNVPSPSAFVLAVTGVDNVCERAAVAGKGALIAPKLVCGPVTVALALEPFSLSFPESELA